MNEDFLNKKLNERKELNAFRELKLPDGKVDFCSNDYLGLASKLSVTAEQPVRHGSTGSRLLAGNSALVEEVESILSSFHESESGLIFNSGYDANLGLLSSVPQRGDTILYDYLSHASIRDGIRLSFASAHAFRHNDLDDLETKLQHAVGNKFVVTESVFSMDGDCAPLAAIVSLCRKHDANLIVDEAHATGVIGEKGEGLAQKLNLQSDCFARVYTFGKALGCHGAYVAGSRRLRDYLVNFARSFIYTTALPETAISAIKSSYQAFPEMLAERRHLQQLIRQFSEARVGFEKSKSGTPIQAVIVPGNEQAKHVASSLQDNNMDVRAILYPTVPKGAERLRIVLHAFNTSEELRHLIALLSS